MDDTTVTEGDIQALATTLEGMGERFSAQEQATLHALFGLAAAGVAAGADEVTGFGPGTPFGIEVPGTGGRLTGLGQSFDIGVAYGKIGGVGSKGGTIKHPPPPKV